MLKWPFGTPACMDFENSFENSFDKMTSFEIHENFCQTPSMRLSKWINLIDFKKKFCLSIVPMNP